MIVRRIGFVATGGTVRSFPALIRLRNGVLLRTTVSTVLWNIERHEHGRRRITGDTIAVSIVRADVEHRSRDCLSDRLEHLLTSSYGGVGQPMFGVRNRNDIDWTGTGNRKWNCHLCWTGHSNGGLRKQLCLRLLLLLLLELLLHLLL